MPDAQAAMAEGSRPGRVVHALVVAACLLPVLHSATCARQFHEPSAELVSGQLGAFSDLGRALDIVAFSVGVLVTLLTVALLLGVMFGATMGRLLVSVVYGPLLFCIGIVGLRHPDLHRWLWGTSSLVAGAILLVFAASHWLWRWLGSSRERVSCLAISFSCALALLFASLNLPAQTANRVLTDSPLTWTYHRADLKRDPWEKIRRYQCTWQAGRCDCLKTDKEEDRGTCGAQQCCYHWNDTPNWLGDGPSYRLDQGCFCVSVVPGAACPEPSSLFPQRYRASTERSETCP